MTPWTAAYQAPPSMGFSRQEYWSGVPLPSPSNSQKEMILRVLPIYFLTVKLNTALCVHSLSLTVSGIIYLSSIFLNIHILHNQHNIKNTKPGSMLS